MLVKQAGTDRYAYNKLEIFREEHHRAGRVNMTRGRINGWHMDLRNI